MQSKLLSGIVIRSNLNRIFVSMLVLIIAVAMLLSAQNAYYNLFSGPFPSNPKTIENLTTLEGLEEYYITFTADDFYDTGYQRVTRLYGIIETGYESFIALLVGEHLLLTSVDGDPTETRTYTGSLESIPSDLEREVLNELIREVPELEGAFLPFMLNASNFQLNVGGPMVIGLVIALSAFGLLLYTVLGMRDYRSHGLVRKLSRLGDADQVALDIEQALAADHAVFNKKTHLIRNMLVHRTRSDLQAMRYTDMMWLYPFVQSQRQYGVQVSKSHFVVLWDRHGEKLQIAVPKEKDMLALLEAVAQQAPWVIAGYSQDIERVWQRDRQGFIAKVDARKAEMKTQR